MKYLLILFAFFLFIPTSFAAIERFDDTPYDEMVDQSGGSLYVDVTEDYKLGTKVPVGANRVDFLTIHFTAKDGPVTLNGMKIKRIGLGDRKDFDGVMIYQERQRKSYLRKFNADEIVTFRFNPPFVMEPGSSATLTIKANISGRAQPGSEHAMRIHSLYTDARTIVENIPLHEPGVVETRVRVIREEAVDEGLLPPGAEGTTGSATTRVTVRRPDVDASKLRVHLRHWNRLCTGEKIAPICPKIERIINELQ